MGLPTKHSRKDIEMKYDFDQIIDRNNTNALKRDGWREYIFHAGPDKKFAFADDEFIHMWVADMEFRCADEIIDAIHKRVDHGIFGYTTVYNDDYPNAFADWCKRRYDWEFNKEDLCYSPGIIPALYELVGDICENDDDKVLFQTPSYGFFKHASTYNGKEMVFNKMKWNDGLWEMDFDDLAEKAADPKVKVLVFCNPQNPTGRVWTEEELKKVAEIVEKNDLYIISDEIHCDMRRSGVGHIPMGKIMKDYPKLVTSMSASKCFNMAGLQLSNIIIRDPKLRQKFVDGDKLVGFLNPISITAMQAAYEHGEDWLNQMNDYVEENFKYIKKFFDEKLPEVKFEIPDSTYLAWVNFGKVLPEGTDVNDFFANKAGVLIEGDDALFVDNAKGFVRLNLAMPKSQIEIAMDRMYDAIEAAGGRK